MQIGVLKKFRKRKNKKEKTKKKKPLDNNVCI